MKIPRILVVPIWVAIVAGFATLVGLIANWCNVYDPLAWGVYTLFGIFGAFILFIAGRQLYWLLTGKGDYEGGGLPKLWKKIFKK